MKTWRTYILLCDQKTFYVGLTNDLNRRITEHENKESFFTKKFSEIKLVHQEQFNTKSEAVGREKQLKGWSRKKKLNLMHNSL